MNYVRGLEQTPPLAERTKSQFHKKCYYYSDMKKFESQQHRDTEMEINQEPDKEKRRAILAEQRTTKEYQEALTANLTPEQEKTRNELIEAFTKFEKEGFLGEYGHKSFPNLLSQALGAPDVVLRSVRNLGEQTILLISKTSYTQHIPEVISAFKLKNEILSTPEIKQALREEIVNQMYDLPLGDGANQWTLLEGWIEYALEADELRNIAIYGFKVSLHNGYDVESALKIRDKFLPKITTSKDFFDIFPATKILAEQINEQLPGFNEQVRRSLDLLFILITYEDNPTTLVEIIQDNPYIIDAFKNNPRMGPKLFFAFPKFDIASRENIATLFKAKNNVPPDIGPNSHDFRIHMQGELMEFKRNEKILDRSMHAGIDTKTWLSYSRELEFVLHESNEQALISDVLGVPIERINTTLQLYKSSLKENLRAVKKELQKYQVPVEDMAVVVVELEKMKKALLKAEEEKNEKKVAGITKGIEKFKERMEKPKATALWGKLLGNYQAITFVMREVLDVNEKLKQEEKELREILATKSGKDSIRKKKGKIGELKENIRVLMLNFIERFESYRSKLRESLVQALGNEKGNEISQTLTANFTEPFIHYKEDIQTINSLFSKDGKTSRELLDDTPMSIKVWSRDPDTDLYLGNYSPCCISIESGMAGDPTQSTIADYLTDLGIQVVSVWDEAKDVPVASAWCWLGKSGDKTAMIIDNIEANTTYSTSYPDEIGENLMAYLTEYGMAIGVHSVELGEFNNDLPSKDLMEKFTKGTMSYKKLGGANRDDGYFLESEEEKGLRTVWKK